MTPDEERKRLAVAVGSSLFALEDGRRYLVGRSPSCELRINHQSVSERHCVLSCANGEVVVEDLGSRNGTMIGPDRVKRDVARPGQTITVGAIELALRDASAGPALAPLRPIVDPRLRFRQTSFAELMALELRRAPWFTLSAAIHLLIFLILYHLLDVPPSSGERRLALAMDQPTPSEALDEAETPPEVEVREEQEVLEELSFEDPFEVDLDDGRQDGLDEGVDLASPGLAGTSWLQNVKGSGTGILGHAAVRAGGFGKTVSKIRRTGLEIVFVFDSTGSMGSILQGTKERIAHMLELLHELVPDARVGVITYRDRDPSEEYLTRGIPLGHDFYRAVNFMQVIDAGGGGNRPEAVLDGLRDAVQQKWHPKARRVVVLIGDAPAHKFDQRKIKQMLQSFTSNGRSFVHSIVTSPYGSDSLEPDTRKSFEDIARAGKGECIGFEDESKVLQQVLSLAFGREYRKNLDEASRVLQESREKVSTAALDLVQREELEKLEQKLREKIVSDEIVKALARSSSKKIALFLVDLLQKPDLDQPGRQAAVYALQRMMNGRLAPAIERILAQAGDEGSAPRRRPWEMGVLPSRRAAHLRRLIGG